MTTLRFCHATSDVALETRELPDEEPTPFLAFTDEDFHSQDSSLFSADQFFAKYSECKPARCCSSSEAQPASTTDFCVTATVRLDDVPSQTSSKALESLTSVAASAALAAFSSQSEDAVSTTATMNKSNALAISSAVDKNPTDLALVKQQEHCLKGVSAVRNDFPMIQPDEHQRMSHPSSTRHALGRQSQPTNYPKINDNSHRERMALSATARSNTSAHYGWGSCDDNNFVGKQPMRRGLQHYQNSANGWEDCIEGRNFGQPSPFQTASDFKSTSDKLGRGGKSAANRGWSSQRINHTNMYDCNANEEECQRYDDNTYANTGICGAQPRSRVMKRKFSCPEPQDAPQGGKINGRFSSKQKQSGAASSGGNMYGRNSAAPPYAVASSSNCNSGVGDKTNKSGHGGDGGEEADLPEKLKGCDPKLVEQIENEIVDRGHPITFNDIAGLKEAKESVYELVCWPMKRPDLFTGLRSLPKGLLLFGPPGTGKTLIGKAIAHESGATFFSISASSLMSKWTGESERLVKTLFAVASYREPAVVFIDEVDSLLTARSSDENEASRRLKTEFLVQLDGAATPNDRVLVVGATNRPHELDEAARRRFVKKLYIPLPEAAGRRDLVQNLLKKNLSSVSGAQVEEIVRRTDGFSGADLRSLCTEAAMGPIRDSSKMINRIDESQLPPISFRHFSVAMRSVRPSVAQKDLDLYIKWNAEFGTFHRAESDESVDDNEVPIE